MRAALAALSTRPPGRRVVALGEMLEIGAGSADAHAGLAPLLQEAGVELAFLAGVGMEALSTVLPSTIQQHFDVKAAALLESVKNRLTDGDVLLVKGSNASGMGRLADALRAWSNEESAENQARETGGPARGDHAV